MSIEVKTDESLPAPVATRDEIATQIHVAMPAWRRRRYQVSALLVGVLVVAALAANNFLALA